MTGITRDDWMQAMADAGMAQAEDDQSAITVKEFMAMFDPPMTFNPAKAALEKLVTMGKATKTFKRVRDGVRVDNKPAYRLSNARP